MKSIILHLWVLILMVCSVISCSSSSTKLESALSFAGENRAELETVLNYYSQNESDSLKYRAAVFLIENMPYHMVESQYLASFDGKFKTRPNSMEFETAELYLNYCDSLLSNGYFIEKSTDSDLKVIKAGYLIENIELAFEAWGNPWSKNTTFDQFCNYILPYKLQTEMPSDYRRYMMDLYTPILDSAGVKSPIEATQLINKMLIDDIIYAKNAQPLFSKVEDTFKLKKGQCAELCNLATFILRSVGVPTTYDTTIWARVNMGHTWCAVLNGDEFYTFDAMGKYPDQHKHIYRTYKNRKPVKVYRYSFKPVEDKVFKYESDGYKTFLKSSLISDVTKEYWDNCSNFSVKIDRKFDIDKQTPLYLCVLNNDNWKPIAVADFDSNTNICTFNDVAVDNILIIAKADNNDLTLLTHPFYLSPESKINYFVPDKTETEEIVISNIGGRMKYWSIEEQTFIPIEPSFESDSTIHYKGIYKNTLVKFKPNLVNKIVRRPAFMQNGVLTIY